MQTATLKRALREEAATLKRFADLQKSLQKAISMRQWTELNKEVQNLRVLADRIESLEEGRIEAYRELREALAARDQEGFASVVGRLPADERDEILKLYRHLKAAVIRVKASAGLLSYYINSMSDALRQILEELFPHRKGKFYSRTGKAKEAAEESLMLYGNA